jgi:Fur family ferric uptake transcriptional regulator
VEPDTKPESRSVNLEQLEERFKSFLYAQKGKVTNERLALLRTLYSYQGHFSVDELMELMERQNHSVSRATVYRTLDLLVQSGLVRKLMLEGQETRYESALDSGHHDHIICVDCHKIIEFFNPELEQIQDEILDVYNLKPVKHIHQLYGSCTLADCPEKNR